MTDKTGIQIIKAPAVSNSVPLHQFTPLDRISFTWVLRGTWIFRGHLDANCLREGLVKTLALYPHLAGRIEWDKGVRVNNEGIYFTTISKHDITIADVEADRKGTNQYSVPLLKRHMKSGKSPLITVKLTFVRDGTVLGVCGTHALFDGASFYRFIYHWACICAGKPFEPPITDQTIYPVNDTLSANNLLKKALRKGFVQLDLATLLVALKNILLPGRSTERTRGFHLPADFLKHLKEKVSEDAECTCSTNEALSAYIVLVCSHLNGHAGTAIPYSTVNVIDCRSRISFIPKFFSGNASYMINTPALPAGASLGARARAIHDALAPVLFSNSPELEELIKLAVDITVKKMRLLPFKFSKAFCAKPTIIYINNFCRLPIYNVDFGTGIPFAVIPHNLSDPLLIWPSHPDKGGLEIYFTGSLAHTINRKKLKYPWLDNLKPN